MFHRWFLLGLIAILMLASTDGYSQARPSKRSQNGKSSEKANNVIYIELLGNGVIYSLNYERMLSPNLSLRAGLSLPYAGLLMVNALIGNGSSKLELGGGVITYFFESSEGIHPTGTVGYRYQPLDGGFTFKIGLTPTEVPNFFTDGYTFIPWAGIGFGLAF